MIKNTLLIILIITLFSMASCGDDDKNNEPPVNPAKMLNVKVKKVTLNKIPIMVAVPGAVVPDQKAKIASRLMGYIKNIKMKVGEKVKAGDLLFTIDPSDINSKINQAKSSYKQALAALNNSKLEYDRFSKLYKDDTVSKQEYDKKSLHYSTAQQKFASAKSGLTQAKSQLNYANVTAPFDGVIVQKLAVAGDLASPGKTIVVLENLSSLSVLTQVSNALYTHLHLKDKALIKVNGIENNFVGSISTLVSALDPKTRTHTVKLSLKKMHNVNSGTFARVMFNKGFRKTILVNRSAIINRLGIIGVFVMDDENFVHFRMVRAGMTMWSMVEIQSGLSLGETIVIDNNQSLINGDKVKPSEVTVQTKGE